MLFEGLNVSPLVEQLAKWGKVVPDGMQPVASGSVDVIDASLFPLFPCIFQADVSVLSITSRYVILFEY